MQGYGRHVPGVVFVNPRAGQGTISEDDLRERLPDHRIEPCEPAHLAARVSRAAEDGEVEFVGVSGGDGSIGSAAGVLAEGPVPLLAIPGGTRNHFARDLGVETLDHAVRAVESGTVRSVDLGSVGDHWFVNNASIGSYPAMVRRRELHERRFRKGVSNLVAMVEQIRHGRRFVTEIDHDRHETWAVFVGNGRYGDQLADLATRESLDDGVLDVRIVSAEGQLTRLRVVLATLAGRLSSSPLVERICGSSVWIDLRDHEVDVALDGEVLRMRTPLVFACRPRALRVLVPTAASDPDGTGPHVAEVTGGGR